MATIARVEIRMVDLKPKVKRVDAIQSFVSQETPFVRITDSDGAVGVGYSYTIGTGGPAIVELLARSLAPALLGRDGAQVEKIWRDLLFLTHATSVGAITSLAPAAIDTALWDLRLPQGRTSPACDGGRRQGPDPSLHPRRAAGCIWPKQALVDDALKGEVARLRGLQGQGRATYPRGRRTTGYAARGARLASTSRSSRTLIRAFNVDEAIRRARHYEAAEDIKAGSEEPLPADDIEGHVRLLPGSTFPSPLQLARASTGFHTFATICNGGPAPSSKSTSRALAA